MDELARLHLQEQYHSLRTMWEQYLQLYFFAWTANLAALAWIYAKTVSASSDHPSQIRKRFAWLFCLADLPVIGTSGLMLPATWEYDSRIRLISEKLAGMGQLTDVLQRPAFPPFMTYYSAVGNAVAILALAWLWAWLALKERQPGIERAESSSRRIA